MRYVAAKVEGILQIDSVRVSRNDCARKIKSARREESYNSDGNYSKMDKKKQINGFQEKDAKAIRVKITSLW